MNEFSFVASVSGPSHCVRWLTVTANSGTALNQGIINVIVLTRAFYYYYPPIRSLPCIKCGVLGGPQPVLEAGITVFKSKCATTPSFMHVA